MSVLPSVRIKPAIADSKAPQPIIIDPPRPEAAPASLGLTASIPAVAFGIQMPFPKPTNAMKPKNVSAVPELVKYFKKLKLKEPLVVSPDLGGKKRAQEFAKLLGSSYIALKKKRNRKTGKVKIVSTNLKQVIGKDIILVDDMISSGGSIIKATEFLKKQKCKRVFVSCTHALLVDNAEKRIKKAGVSKIVSTNTIPGPTSKVDVSNIIAKTVM